MNPMLSIKSAWQALLWSGLLLWPALGHAHGLHMSSAHIVQRQDNYLYITIETSLPALFKQLDYADKPASLAHLAAGSALQLNQFRQALVALFQQQLQLSVAGQPLQSLKVRLWSEADLHRHIQDEVANELLAALPGGGHPHDGRDNYLRVEVDGFIASGANPRLLQATFPKALGQMMVSYSKPVSQTISPGTAGSVYQQALQK